MQAVSSQLFSARPPAAAKPQTYDLIVTGTGVQDLVSFSNRSDLEVRAQLELIGGLAIRADQAGLEALEQFCQSHQGVKVFEDAPVEIIRPIEEEISPLLDTGAPTIRADELWAQGITGKGVTVAVIDTGIAPHPDIRDRIIGFHDLVNGRSEPYDDQGHGTHVAGTVAGDGKMSDGVFKGAAPEASLVGVKVLDGSGRGKFSDIIRGIQWAVENKDRLGIRAMNLSLGGRASKSYKDDPVAQAITAAAGAGIVPCVAAGNSGPGSRTIGTPAHALDALTVGADDDRATRDISDDRVANFSSRGPTPVDGLTKPDVIAPGVNITAADNRSNGYRTLSGTSMATPMTAGVVALLVQAHPEARVQDIKTALMDTARPLDSGGNANQQGSGLIDAVEAHRRLMTAPEPQ
ncbi:MAG: S8 family peptidase [Candidatus Eremiobacteraeota bacterium]|nr:S8 family peptidase [Candidatus Eremiobacteraeota bacterium]